MSVMGFVGSSISGGEILIVFVVMLLLFGSKKLPSMARNLGKAVEEFRRASRNVTDEIMRADLEDEPPPKRSLAAKPSSEPEATPAADEPSEPAPTPRPAANAMSRDEGTA